jgi:hypothetical protein
LKVCIFIIIIIVVVIINNFAPGEQVVSCSRGAAKPVTRTIPGVGGEQRISIVGGSGVADSSWPESVCKS